MKKIFYVGDPVCSWCYAFTDIFEEIKKEFSKDLSFSYLMGGLVFEREIVLDRALKRLLKKNWKEVETKTGKHIKASVNIEEARETPYISDPGCIGFQAIKLQDEELAYKFYKNMHIAFYEKLENIFEFETLLKLAVEIGIDKNYFSSKFNDPVTKELAVKDIEKAKELGVRAFPSLVLQDESGTKVLNQGFRKYSLLKVQIESWLQGKLSAGDILPVL
ncbi:MAG: DsbA family protein [Desulforegulaceae bacterium]|nr:DsbA family protein [Desulforegulaceae bacterium]